MPAVLALFSSLALPFALWMVFFQVPTEATMGEVQKIFYLHLPLGLWGLVSFTVVFVCGVAYLVRKSERMAALAQAACEIGVLFSGLSLLSGMLWAKKSWGVWWTWDPRLSTTLVMWFIYCGYLLLQHIGWEAERRNLICAIYAIVAFLDVPLVFLSARIFRSIHPAVLGNGGLEPEMWLTTGVCALAFGLLWGSLLLIRKEQLWLETRLAELAQRTF